MEPPAIALLLLFLWAISTFGKAKRDPKYNYVRKQSWQTNPVAAAITKGYNAVGILISSGLESVAKSR